MLEKILESVGRIVRAGGGACLGWRRSEKEDQRRASRPDATDTASPCGPFYHACGNGGLSY